MAFTQSDIDTLKSALASGVQTVELADRRVTYRSLDELKEAIRMAEAELGVTPDRVKPRFAFPMTGKGF